MNICRCGTKGSYPHDPFCPYPLYRGDALQLNNWDLSHAILQAMGYLRVCHLANHAGAQIKVDQAIEVLLLAYLNVKESN